MANPQSDLIGGEEEIVSHLDWLPTFGEFTDLIGLHMVVGVFFGSMLLSRRILGKDNYAEVEKTTSGMAIRAFVLRSWTPMAARIAGDSSPTGPMAGTALSGATTELFSLPQPLQKRLVTASTTSSPNRCKSRVERNAT